MTEMLKTDFANISDLNRGNARKVIDKVKDNTSVYIMKNNMPEVVMVSVDVFNEIQEMLFNKKVAERLALYETNPDNTISGEEVMNRLGITQEEIDAMPDVELDYD